MKKAKLPEYIKVPIEHCTTRQKVMLLDWSEYTIQEIADALDVFPGSVRNAITECKKRGIYVVYGVDDAPKYTSKKCIRCKNYSLIKHRAHCCAFEPPRAITDTRKRTKCGRFEWGDDFK